MKKEVSLALLGVSIALGTVGAGYAMVPSMPERPQPTSSGTTLMLAAFTSDDLRQIQQCLVNADVLCLRNFLTARPELLQCAVAPFDPSLTEWEINVCQALLNFWLASDNIDGRDFFAELRIALSATAAIYA